jgi:hypothetical protein
MYMYMYIYIHTYIHTYIYTYSLIYHRLYLITFLELVFKPLNRVLVPCTCGPDELPSIAAKLIYFFSLQMKLSSFF